MRIDPYLNFGADNEIRVECRAHLDSRWYTGAGIYRDVHLIVEEPGPHRPRRRPVTTPDIDSDRAVVEVAVEVENSGPATTTLTLAAAVAAEDMARSSAPQLPVTLLPGDARHRASAALRRRTLPCGASKHPSLYAVRLTLGDGDTVVDEEPVTFGIRSLQLDPRHGLRINGES